MSRSPSQRRNQAAKRERMKQWNIKRGKAHRSTIEADIQSRLAAGRVALDHEV